MQGVGGFVGDSCGKNLHLVKLPSFSLQLPACMLACMAINTPLHKNVKGYGDSTSHGKSTVIQHTLHHCQKDSTLWASRPLAEDLADLALATLTPVVWGLR